MKRTLLFDTETTDLVQNSLLRESHQPHVIEFFGQIVDEEGAILEELEFLCNPGFTISEETTRITGIKPEQLKNEAKFSDRAIEVSELIGRCDSVVAHNLSYDYFVIETEFKRLGMMPAWPIVRICTVEETEWIKGYRLSLSALHEELFAETFKGAHRARVDVEALTRCFVELRKRGDI